jgi:hypothetical protein
VDSGLTPGGLKVGYGWVRRRPGMLRVDSGWLKVDSGLAPGRLRMFYKILNRDMQTRCVIKATIFF